MLRFFALLLCALPVAGPAMSEADRPVLVELFANQNCPACPKAHRTMRQIEAERDDVFILTWIVNYWDYLGEPDPMAMAVSRDRQMAYTDRLALRAPYTPQSFYDGAKECPGTRKSDISRNIAQRMQTREPGTPDMIWNRDTRQIALRGQTDVPLQLSIVEYLSGNDNQTSMVNPVIAMESFTAWHGGDITYQVACKSRCAALLHHRDAGEVLIVLPLD